MRRLLPLLSAALLSCSSQAVPTDGPQPRHAPEFAPMCADYPPALADSVSSTNPMELVERFRGRSIGSDSPPQILNEDEVARYIARSTPSNLLPRGSTSVSVVFLFVSASGEPVTSRLARSSGSREVDQIALRAAMIARFSPAMRGDCSVPIWNSMPITVRSR